MAYEKTLFRYIRKSNSSQPVRNERQYISILHISDKGILSKFHPFTFDTYYVIASNTISSTSIIYNSKKSTLIDFHDSHAAIVTCNRGHTLKHKISPSEAKTEARGGGQERVRRSLNTGEGSSLQLDVGLRY